MNMSCVPFVVVRTSPQHRQLHIITTAVVNGNLKHKKVKILQRKDILHTENIAKAIIHRPIVKLRIFAKEHVIIAVNMW